MKRLKFLLFLHIIIPFLCYSQLGQVEISGKVYNQDRIIFPNQKVFLLKDKDTLLQTISDANGLFHLELLFTTENTYSIGLQANKTYANPIVLHQKGDSLSVLKTEYMIDLMQLKIFHDFIDYSAYYEKNNVSDFSNFTTEMLKELLIEYPDICIRFSQTIIVDESKRIAKKRMKNFNKQLELENLPMKQLLFDEGYRFLDINLEDQRSRIQGVINSMNGGCK